VDNVRVLGIVVSTAVQAEESGRTQAVAEVAGLMSPAETAGLIA